MRIYILRASLLFLLITAFFDASATESTHSSRLTFEENKGQWPSQVLFKTDVKSGRLFLEKDKFTYVFYSTEDLESIHDVSHEHEDGNSENSDESKIHCHAFKVNLLGSTGNPIAFGEEKKQEYHNYFIGNDPGKWASHVDLYNAVMYTGVYPSVDMRLYSRDGNLKYDFILHSYTDPRQIQMSYEGVNALSLSDGNLVIRTSVNEMTEQKPYAYQEINGEKKEVRCQFILRDHVVSFDILSDYDHSLPLIIDPVVIASTYSGSTATTYGHCATFDNQGNVFTGGRCFGIGYPASVGAFDLTFGGQVDIAISKLNPTGTALIYATYLGGSQREFAHSMYVNDNDELCIYGSTVSSDYPTSAGCYRNLSYGNTDIVVTHLDANGSTLIGSTYIGGVDDDGNNVVSSNYGDEFRGEIVVDSLNNIYVASFSESQDFPVTSGAQTNSGKQDGVLFALNATCSSLLWSTYLGGSENDAAFGIRLDGTGGVIITGTTESSDFPATPGSYQPSYLGGSMDGFIARISVANNSLLASTFFGSPLMDGSFFVDTDENMNIYIFGQTEDSLETTFGHYNNPGGKNFLAKLDPSLSTLEFQITIGNNNVPDGISPTAFLVDYCGNIYLSGFRQGGFGTGYPTTPDAFYSNQSIGNFYLAVLSENADSLLFGTYYGGGHVDGGTSRFDKNGIVYQGVCQGGTSFPTLPGSVGTTTTVSWDQCVFKIDFQTGKVSADAQVSPSNAGCQPFLATFNNLSNGTSYLWDFGDGSPQDTSKNPTHTFQDTGTFQVVLIAINPNSCNLADTFELNVIVAPPLSHHATIDTIICGTPSLTLQPELSGTGYSYSWSNGSTGTQLVVTTPATYWVNISIGSCAIKDSFRVEKLIPPNLGPDSNLCEGVVIVLNPHSNATSYLWSTGDTVTTIQANLESIYWVDAYKQDCILRDSIVINLLEFPVVYLGPDTTICPNSLPVVSLNAGNSPGNILWSTGDTTRQIFTTTQGDYWVEISNAHCVTVDSILVSYAPPLITPQPDPVFCDYANAFLDAQVENVSYLWNTGETTKAILVNKPGDYWYRISYLTCTESDTVGVWGTFGEDLLWIPKAFTPNADGRNDIFLPIGTDILQFNIFIYNRWGQPIFTSNDLNIGWDGRQENHMVQPGVYTYKVEYLTSCSENPVLKTGFVLVVE